MKKDQLIEQKLIIILASLENTTRLPLLITVSASTYKEYKLFCKKKYNTEELFIIKGEHTIPCLPFRNALLIEL